MGLSAILFFFALMTYELYVLYAPIFVGVALLRRHSARAALWRIVAPTLFEPALSLSFAGTSAFSNWRGRRVNYWTGYVRRLGGRDVAIRPTMRRSRKEIAVGTYYLRHFQEDLLGNQCSLVFARLSSSFKRSEARAVELIVVHGTPGALLTIPIVGSRKEARVHGEGTGPVRVEDHTAFVEILRGTGDGNHRIWIEGGEFDVGGMMLGRRIP